MEDKKRSVLLFGPQGSGKSLISDGLARVLDLEPVELETGKETTVDYGYLYVYTQIPTNWHGPVIHVSAAYELVYDRHWFDNNREALTARGLM